MDGEKLIGTLSTAETINLDDEAQIREIEGESTEYKTTSGFDSTLMGDCLVFENKAADGDEIDTYKMYLSRRSTAGRSASINESQAASVEQRVRGTRRTSSMDARKSINAMIGVRHVTPSRDFYLGMLP